jgi:hypothetical protein
MLQSAKWVMVAVIAIILLIISVIYWEECWKTDETYPKAPSSNLLAVIAWQQNDDAKGGQPLPSNRNVAEKPQKKALRAMPDLSS